MLNSEIISNNLFQVSLCFPRHNSTCQCATVVVEECNHVHEASKQVGLEGLSPEPQCVYKKARMTSDLGDRSVQEEQQWANT